MDEETYECPECGETVYIDEDGDLGEDGHAPHCSRDELIHSGPTHTPKIGPNDPIPF